MRNKRLIRTLSTLCLTLVLASGFTVPAFAQGAAPPPAEDTTNDSNVVVEETVSYTHLILACALSALAVAFSVLRIGFSSAGSARSSSVKRRRGSLFLSLIHI